MRLCYTVASLTVVALAMQAVTHDARAHRRPRALCWPTPAPSSAVRCSSCSEPFLFLYVSCEVGVWNWLPRHLIAQGIPESRALNILSLGFALGLLIGRVGVSPILISVPPIRVTLAASIAMAVTTFLMLRTAKPAAAAALVFVAGLSMAPVFPTTLAIVGTAFPRMTGTAIGFVITCGWVGLAVSSRIIGAIAGGDPLRLKKALLLIAGLRGLDDRFESCDCGGALIRKLMKLLCSFAENYPRPAHNRNRRIPEKNCFGVPSRPPSQGTHEKNQKRHRHRVRRHLQPGARLGSQAPDFHLCNGGVYARLPARGGASHSRPQEAKSGFRFQRPHPRLKNPKMGCETVKSL